MSVQKSLSNHEHVMQHVMSYLHSADGIIRGVRRGSRQGRASLPGAPDGASVAPGMSAAHGISPVDDSFPSPLQNAERLLQDASTETLQHQRNLEQLNDLYRQAHGGLNHSSPETPISHHDTNLPASGAPAAPAPAAEPVIDYTRIPTDLQDAVYPVGHNNGIDPMFGEHVHNIPYPLPTSGDQEHPTDPRKAFAEGRKRSTTIDPGWIRAPQILLVEDDPTCRRIGGKFLYSFKCAIDSAVGGNFFFSSRKLFLTMLNDGRDSSMAWRRSTR